MSKSQHIKTLGALKESGYRPRSIKIEIRDNLRKRLKGGGPLFPGILGYDRTVIPSVVNALLAGHDFILLGLRGQAKTRILRSLVTLMDPEVPVLAGSLAYSDADFLRRAGADVSLCFGMGEVQGQGYIAQALGVVGLTVLEYLGYRRSDGVAVA